jgi:hypothetical protein
LGTKYGEQPARDVLRKQGRSVAGTSRAIGIGHGHFRQALAGRVRPSMELRDKLPAWLGVPLHELFTERALRPPLERLDRAS